MRRILVAAIAVAILLVPVDLAVAKGSSLETQRPFYAVGQVAVARRGFVGTPDTVSDGPYYAYLIPGYRWFKSPGPVPRYATPIGRMSITEGTWYRWVARLEFAVPDLPTGRYSIQYCNHPCTVDVIGDLYGGSFFIGQTVEEARLAMRVEHLRSEVQRLGRRARQAQELERDLRATEEIRDRALAENRRLHERIGGLESALAAERASRPRRVPAPWAAAIIAVSGAVVAVSIVRDRRRRPAVPGTVPPELLKEAQVPSRHPATSAGSPGIVMASPGSSSSEDSPVTKS